MRTVLASTKSTREPWDSSRFTDWVKNMNDGFRNTRTHCFLGSAPDPLAVEVKAHDLQNCQQALLGLELLLERNEWDGETVI